MSGDERKGGDGEPEGFPKTARLIMLAVVALAQAIPGYSLMSAGDWHPPDMGAVFAATAVMVGAGTVGLLFLARRHVQALRARVIIVACFAALVLSLGMMALYRTALEARVVQYAWAEAEYRQLIPFGTSRWTPPELLKRIQQVNDGAPPSRSALRPSHFRAVLQEYGPEEVTPYFPAGWGLLTRGLLWGNYVVVLMLVTAAFAAPAVRLEREFRARKAAAPKPEPEPARQSVPASPPVEDPSTARLALMEAELQHLRARLYDERRPSRDGESRDEAVLRVEVRGGGWLLLGAAAVALWATTRARDGTHRGSRPR
ncbi:hypothetical protein [Longimicrobium sp.]|jgi:hypothetical protein|uniref:hypothetical protein n=1 Tax=Longimicrobium sp. TaxID=2029185 RepID=UPI002F92396F